jgi:hypothetical protein
MTTMRIPETRTMKNRKQKTENVKLVELTGFLFSVCCFRFAVSLPTVALMSLLAACGTDGAMKSEDYGNLLNSPAGLIVVEEEHQTGFGRTDCLLCHETRNIHTVNRTGLPSCPSDGAPEEGCIDLADVRQLVKDQGQASCPLCHGDNGVVP